MGDFRQAFGDAVHRLRSNDLARSRDVYFATYQTLDRAAPEDVPSADEGVEPSVFHALAPDFFDLIIVDECHRGSAPRSRAGGRSSSTSRRRSRSA